MNKFIFSGNLGRDAEVSATQTGTTLCKFSVAVKSGWGERQQTMWINCVIFGKRAEGGLPQYLTKGRKVFVTGELSHREYQKKDGTFGSSLEVNVEDVELAGGQDDAPQQQQTYGNAAQKPQQSYQQPRQKQANTTGMGGPMFPGGGQQPPAGGMDEGDDIPF